MDYQQSRNRIKKYQGFVANWEATRKHAIDAGLDAIADALHLDIIEINGRITQLEFCYRSAPRYWHGKPKREQAADRKPRKVS